MKSLALPPFIMTSEEGSFARKTIAESKPLIIDQVLLDNDFPPDIQKALLAFRSELTSGKIRLLEEDVEDRAGWDHDITPWLGKTWLEIPWYLAEAYFFRRVLEATRYFHPGQWQRYDPYRILKDKEITDALPQFISAYLNTTQENSYEGFSQSIVNALWGNQSDLSNLDRGLSAQPERLRRLLRDDSIKAYQYLANHPANIIYFLDNVGKELYFDLAAMDYLLHNGLALSITVWLKNQPFFVSDVMKPDFIHALNYLENSSAEGVRNLSSRVRKAIADEKILLETPEFLTTGRMYRQLPSELADSLRQCDLAILKGDVNHRRLVGDRHWDPVTPIERAAGYFPTSFLSLRTLKAELVVGLEQDQVRWMKKHAEDNWMINGHWGLILFLQKSETIH